MITDIALIVLAALLLNFVFTKAGLPGLLGMMLTGVFLGPSVFDLINNEILLLLREFKTAALIVILIRAGLGINKKTLKKVGMPAVRMSFIPGIIEGATILVLAVFVLRFTWVEGGILGFIIAAVSPAVVVPQMLNLKDMGFGKKKEVPTLVLAGASVDDVFAITIFGIFIGIAEGGNINLPYLVLSVPLGIVLGAVIGAGIGLVLVWYFKKFHLRDTKKVILFVIVAVLFVELCEMQKIKQLIPLAGLLGVMTIGFILLERYPKLANRMSAKFGKVWVIAEILLFVYIGTELRIETITLEIIGVGLLLLFVGLAFRSLGVGLSLLGTNLNRKERLFCMVAYWPKATVQAAIGAIPLALVLDGSIQSISVDTARSILSFAVLSIIVTAPIGAIAIRTLAPKLLQQEPAIKQQGPE